MAHMRSTTEVAEVADDEIRRDVLEMPDVQRQDFRALGLAGSLCVKRIKERPTANPSRRSAIKQCEIGLQFEGMNVEQAGQFRDHMGRIVGIDPQPRVAGQCGIVSASAWVEVTVSGELTTASALAKPALWARQASTRTEVSRNRFTGALLRSLIRRTASPLSQSSGSGPE